MKELRATPVLISIPPGAPVINDIKSTKTRPMLQMWVGLHFQNRWMESKCHHNNKVQNYKKINNSHKFLPTGTIYFQASQQIKPGDDILLSVSKMKHFLSTIGEKYTLQKKSNTSSDAPNSQHFMLNEVTETIITMDDKQTDTAEPAHKSVDEVLLSLWSILWLNVSYLGLII